MPRMARRDLLYDGCYAHIISRSIRKMKLMRDDVDFKLLYQLLIETKGKADYRVHHYCLMQTHFHLVVSMADVAAFSGAMGFVKSRYSYHYHTKYHLNGPLWRERYRGLLIENDQYMVACGSYVEHNPVKAQLVKEPRKWLYSSYSYYNEGREDPLVSPLDVGNPTAPVDAGDDPEDFFEKGKIIGSPFFKFQFYKRIKNK
ncbi:MAG: transposase [Candidatus Omnitrophica bacterium]|nr:transposase [Candidatus Omnitrophota bacterium]